MIGPESGHIPNQPLEPGKGGEPPKRIAPKTAWRQFTSNKWNVSFLSKAIRYMRTSLSGISRIRESKTYSADVNELIKFSYSAVGKTLKERIMGQKFRELVAKKLANFLFREQKSAGDILNAIIKDLTQNSVAVQDSKDLEAFLSVLKNIRAQGNISPELATAIDQCYLEKMKELGPSSAPRDTPYRPPMDVLTNFLAELWSVAKENPQDADLNQLIENVKGALLSHAITFTLGNVKQLLMESKPKLGLYPSLQSLCDKLLKDLPANQSQLAPTQLYDNMYGRVLESLFIDQLVTSPPPEVKDALYQMGTEVADHLETLSSNQQEYIGAAIYTWLTQKDPRFWFPNTQINNILKISNSMEAFNALLNFLRLPPKNGFEIIARPYLLVKISIALDVSKHYARDLIPPDRSVTNSPEEAEAQYQRNVALSQENEKKMWATVPWMQKANVNYNDHLFSHKGVDPFSVAVKDPQKVGGITAAHHPPVILEESMLPTSRPVMRNKIDFNQLLVDLPTQVMTEHRF